ncbi:uncharacterized protein LOC113519672 [Galleria mellonella]|uniref:Uncharacterized protein LOC113519672 n=1 Tax=Galleria mellonella TaxID=7137 RepID=A0A6J1WWV8_GALME|nr:uncharacterized protein LOC113519672 [Galleria mellonella]XP_026760633.2 uncharacterized protein LOC113519672 [Galleria mellonella]XP_031770044.2 uncharacterized protein LOC113519672 [Galleria mellonella]
MTLLLKSVWRSVLRSGPLNKSLRSQSFSSSVSTELSRARTPDTVMASLKSAPSMSDLLAAIQTHLPAMTHKHMMQALRCLFELQKAGKFEDDTENLIKNPAFNILCQNFKRYAPALDVNESIEATKVLSYLKVPVDSLIVQTLLQMIRCNINMINTRQIMFLHFILRRFDTKNHLVDALKLALPLAFQIHLPLELDNDDLPLLRDMLAYSCAHYLPDRCINNIVTGLLLHDQHINAQIAKSVIWSLCQINCTEEVYPTRVQLLHICYDILSRHIDDLTYEDVLKTAAKIKGRILEKHPEYYHELLMDRIADYVVNHNMEFEKGLLVARVLSRIAHTHLGLVKYLCSLAASNPVTLANARTNILFGFINCLSNNNYTPDPDQWAELQRQISLNPVLNAKNTALPWSKLCLELASLGFYEDKLLDKVFSEDFLKEFLKRDNNTLDYLQILTLYQAVRTFHNDEVQLPQAVLEKAKALYPISSMTNLLEEHLARGLGNKDYLVKNVVLPSGFVADLLLCLKNGYPVNLPPLDGDTKVPIEELNLPEGSLVVCVINFNQGCFSMNSNRLRGIFGLVLSILEKQGYIAVPVNTNEWLTAPEHERTPYLLREINHKCGEVGMKLSAT